MGGMFGVVSRKDCVTDLFFGIDYHSHLGTRRGGMAVYDEKKGFDRAASCSFPSGKFCHYNSWKNQQYGRADRAFL